MVGDLGAMQASAPTIEANQQIELCVSWIRKNYEMKSVFADEISQSK